MDEKHSVFESFKVSPIQRSLKQDIQERLF